MLTSSAQRSRSSLRSRLRSDDGMTLVELAVGMTAAMFVVLAAFTAMTVANNMQTRTSYRIEALSRARNGMERITRDIRAQQCLGNLNDVDYPALNWASDEGLQFYASVAGPTGGGQPMERRRIEWIPAVDPDFKDGGAVTGDIWETVWRAPEKQMPYTWPATPVSKAVIAEDVEKDGVKPIFTYYGFPVAAVDVARPTDLLVTGAFDGAAALNPRGTKSLTVDDAARVVVMKIRFIARAKRNVVAKSAPVPFSNTVSVRTADPTRPGQSPLC